MNRDKVSSVFLSSLVLIGGVWMCEQMNNPSKARIFTVYRTVEL